MLAAIVPSLFSYANANPRDFPPHYLYNERNGKSTAIANSDDKGGIPTFPAGPHEGDAPFHENVHTGAANTALNQPNNPNCITMVVSGC